MGRLANPVWLGMAVTCLGAWGCDAPDVGNSETGLLRVVGISVTRFNRDYPERPPGTALNRPICQIELDVQVLLPDACTGFGEFTMSGPQNNTFTMEMHGVRNLAGPCDQGLRTSFGLCLPGLGADPPPPGLAPGHYGVIVNGFAGGFDIPSPTAEGDAPGHQP